MTKRMTLWERYARHLDRARRKANPQFPGLWQWPAWSAYMAGYRDGKRAGKGEGASHG